MLPANSETARLFSQPEVRSSGEILAAGGKSLVEPYTSSRSSKMLTSEDPTTSLTMKLINKKRTKETASPIQIFLKIRSPVWDLASE